MSKPVIVTDVDGIVLRWASGLPFFLAEYNRDTKAAIECNIDDNFRTASELFGYDEETSKKLLVQYNNSKFIKYLQPYTDALNVINELSKDFDFVAITALGTNDTAMLNRIFNLNAFFGGGTFKEVRCVDYNESKINEYLYVKKKYGNDAICFVDDLAKNLEDCHDVFQELPLLHMPRGERETPKCKHTHVKDWYEVKTWLKDNKFYDYDSPEWVPPAGFHIGKLDHKEVLKNAEELLDIEKDEMKIDYADSIKELARWSNETTNKLDLIMERIESVFIMYLCAKPTIAPFDGYDFDQCYMEIATEYHFNDFGKRGKDDLYKLSETFFKLKGDYIKQYKKLNDKLLNTDEFNSILYDKLKEKGHKFKRSNEYLSKFVEEPTITIPIPKDCKELQKMYPNGYFPQSKYDYPSKFVSDNHSNLRATFKLPPRKL